MSSLQQKAVQLISQLSDDNVIFLIEMIQRLISQEACQNMHPEEDGAAMQAFKRLDAARIEMKQYLPDN